MHAVILPSISIRTAEKFAPLGKPDERYDVERLTRKEMATRKHYERHRVTAKQFNRRELERQRTIHRMLGIDGGDLVKPEMGRGDVTSAKALRRVHAGGTPKRPVASADGNRRWDSVADCATELQSTETNVRQACRRSAKFIDQGVGQPGSCRGVTLVHAEHLPKLKGLTPPDKALKTNRSSRPVIDVDTKQRWASIALFARASGISRPMVYLACQRAARTGLPNWCKGRRIMFASDYEVLKAKLAA